jgi:hypothetical protein
MKPLSVVLLAFMMSSLAQGQALSKPVSYTGKYCEGEGDVDFLRLIDESFAFFHPNPIVPNIAMVYKPEWDTFTEGAGWGAWWIQNSYGFSYAATPFLEEHWLSISDCSVSGKFRVGGVAVMIDNFAIPAATIRGLFDNDYRNH